MKLTMPINRRVKNNHINYEHVAKLILLCSQTHSSDAEAGQNRFKVREGLIQKITGIPLSHDDREIYDYYPLRSNLTAKFLGWSDEDIQEQLVEEALREATDEVEEEYEETGDKSLLGIGQNDEICLTNFTFWEYLDFELARNGLPSNTYRDQYQ